MKKRYFKRWVVNTLVVISCLAIILLGAEPEDLLLFVISKIILIAILTINYYLLSTQSKLFIEE